MNETFGRLLARVDPAVGSTMLAIFALLVVATLIVAALGRWRPALDLEELRLRVRSWWVMVAVFTLAIVVSRNLSILFFAFVSFLALKEYLSLIPTRRADRGVLFWAYLAIPVQYYWVYDEWYGMFIVFIPVYVFLFLPLRMVLIGETSGFLRAAGTLHWGIMVTVFGISHLAYLLVMPAAARNPNGGGAGLLLYLVLLTQLNDVAQYVWGRLFGRHPVIPRVSPKKTVEGLLGGVATTLVLAVVLAPHLTQLTRLQSVAAGLIFGVGGFVGDVVISALKRDLGIKDSGALLPGHGGILDRIDSLTYTAPVFFHVVRYFVH